MTVLGVLMKFSSSRTQASSMRLCSWEEHQAWPLHGRHEHIFVLERRDAAAFVAVEETDTVQLRFRLATFGYELPHQLGWRQGPTAHHIYERKLHGAIVAAVHQFGADELVRAEE